MGPVFPQQLHIFLQVMWSRKGAGVDTTPQYTEVSDLISYLSHSHPCQTHQNYLYISLSSAFNTATQVLEFKPITRGQAGPYLCSAENSVGRSSTEQTIVDVLYAPTILSTEPRVQRSVTVHNKTVSLFRGALGKRSDHTGHRFSVATRKATRSRSSNGCRGSPRSRWSREAMSPS